MYEVICRYSLRTLLLLSSIRQHLINGFGKVAQGAHGVDFVRALCINVHITIACAPLTTRFRVEPDQTTAFALHLCGDVCARIVVIVASITEDNHGRFRGDQPEVILLERVQAVA